MVCGLLTLGAKSPDIDTSFRRMGHAVCETQLLSAAKAANVRFGSLADIGQLFRDVRFTPKSRLIQPQYRRLLPPGGPELWPCHLPFCHMKGSQIASYGKCPL